MMKSRSSLLTVMFLASACAVPGRPPTTDLDPQVEAQAVREALAQAADQAVNRLGRPDGYYGNPRVRIELPEELARAERGLRRYGLERYVEEFVQSMNRAAEAAVPVTKPVLLAEVQDMSLADATAIVHGDDDAATRYFRAHTEAQLAQRLRPVVADATSRAGATAAYKRLLKKAALLDRSSGTARVDLDAYVTRETLAGLYLVMAEEERRIRSDPLARGTDILKRVFR